jgi:ferredoxin/flavodoxin---NADP+ reductase
MANWLQGEIIENRQWNERLFSLRIAASIPEFKAGQFVRIGLEVEGEIVARPYSLVNAPSEPALEIFFNIVPEGPLSPLLAKLHKGDSILVAEKASGFLVIDEIPECRHLWLFATGTGVGPFLSILKTEQPWQRFEKVVLAYSVGTQSDLVYADLMQSLIRQHGPQLSFVPLVTRETVPGALSERIPAAIKSGALEERAGITLSVEDSHVMMCGNSAMIAEVSTLLETYNMRRHRRREPGHITTEKYH